MKVSIRSSTSSGMTASPSRLFFALMLLGCLSAQVSTRIMDPGYYEASNFDDDSYINNLSEDFRQMDSLQGSYNLMNGDIERQRVSRSGQPAQPGAPQKKVYEDALKKIEDYFKGIKKSLPTIEEKLKETAPQFITQLKAELPQFLERMTTADNFEEMKKQFPKTFAKIDEATGSVDKMKASLSIFREELKTKLPSFYQSVRKNIPDSLQTTKSTRSEGQTPMSSSFARQTLDSKIEKIIIEFFVEMEKKVPKFTAVMKEKLPLILDEMKKIIPKDIEKHVTKENFGEFEKLFPKFIAEMRKVSGSVAKMKESVPIFAGELATKMPTYLDGIKTMSTEVFKKVEAKNTQSPGGSSGSSLPDFGDQFVDLLEGMTDPLTKLSDKLKKKSNAILKKIEDLKKKINKEKPALKKTKVVTYADLTTHNFDSLPKVKKDDADSKQKFVDELPRVSSFPVIGDVLKAIVPPYITDKQMENLDAEQKAIIKSIEMEACFTEVTEKGETRFCKKPTYKGAEYNLKHGFYISEVKAKNPIEDKDFLIWSVNSPVVSSNPKEEVKFKFTKTDDIDYVEFEAEYDIPPLVCNVWYVKKDFAEKVVKTEHGDKLKCKGGTTCSCLGGTFEIGKKNDEKKAILTLGNDVVLPREVKKFDNPSAALGIGAIIGIVVGVIAFIAILVLTIIYFVKKRS